MLSRCDEIAAAGTSTRLCVALLQLSISYQGCIAIVTNQLIPEAKFPHDWILLL